MFSIKLLPNDTAKLAGVSFFEIQRVKTYLYIEKRCNGSTAKKRDFQRNEQFWRASIISGIYCWDSFLVMTTITSHHSS